MTHGIFCRFNTFYPIEVTGLREKIHRFTAARGREDGGQIHEGIAPGSQIIHSRKNLEGRTSTVDVDRIVSPT